MSRNLLRKALIPVAAAGLVATGLGATAVSATEAPTSAPAATSEASTAAEPIVDVTDENLQELIDNSAQQQTIFLVTAPSWCGPCQMLDPMIRQKAEADGGKWTLAVVDEANVSQETIGYFGISGYPTMVPYVGGQEQGERAVGVPGGSQAGVDAYVDSVMTGDGGGDPGDGDPGDGDPGDGDPGDGDPGDGDPGDEVGQPIVDVTDENLQEMIDGSAQQNTLFLVTAPAWCGPCQMLDPMIRQKAEADGGKWTLAVVDEANVSESTISHFGISGYPTMIPYIGGQEQGERAEGVPGGSQAGVDSYVDSVMGGGDGGS